MDLDTSRKQKGGRDSLCATSDVDVREKRRLKDIRTYDMHSRTWSCGPCICRIYCRQSPSSIGLDRQPASDTGWRVRHAVGWREHVLTLCSEMELG